MAIIKQYSVSKSIKGEKRPKMENYLDHTRFALSAECYIDEKDIAW